MMGTPPGPQGMMRPAPGPQGMMAITHGAQQGPLSPPPTGHLGSMPQGVVPLSGPPAIHYMGYYPAPYFSAQSAGDSLPAGCNLLQACRTATLTDSHCTCMSRLQTRTAHLITAAVAHEMFACSSFRIQQHPWAGPGNCPNPYTPSLWPWRLWQSDAMTLLILCNHAVFCTVACISIVTATVTVAVTVSVAITFMVTVIVTGHFIVNVTVKLPCRNTAARVHAPAMVVPSGTPGTPPQWPAGSCGPAWSHDAHPACYTLPPPPPPPPPIPHGIQGHVRCAYTNVRAMAVCNIVELPLRTA